MAHEVVFKSPSANIATSPTSARRQSPGVATWPTIDFPGVCGVDTAVHAVATARGHLFNTPIYTMSIAGNSPAWRKATRQRQKISAFFHRATSVSDLAWLWGEKKKRKKKTHFFVPSISKSPQGLLVVCKIITKCYEFFLSFLPSFLLSFYLSFFLSLLLSFFLHPHKHLSLLWRFILFNLQSWWHLKRPLEIHLQETTHCALNSRGCEIRTQLTLSLNAANWIAHFIQSEKESHVDWDTFYSYLVVTLTQTGWLTVQRLKLLNYAGEECEMWQESEEPTCVTMDVYFNIICVHCHIIFWWWEQKPLQLLHSLLITTLLHLMVTSAWLGAERQKLSICLLQTWLLPRYVLPCPHPP